MSGLENMKRQILDEANHSAEEQISKARTKAEEILREAREQMEEQSAVMAKKSAYITVYFFTKYIDLFF